MISMGRNRWIALVAGAVGTAAVFTAIMLMLIFGSAFAEKDRMVLVFVALGPVAVIAVMVGYSVWWGVLFLLTLFVDEKRDDRPPW